MFGVFTRLSMIYHLSILFKVPNAVSNTILLNKSVSGDTVLIECLSRAALTFKFTEKDLNSTVTIAMCETFIQTCYVVSDNKSDSWTITHTGNGGLLRVLNQNQDLHGTYICCESYSPRTCNSTSVNFNAGTTTYLTTISITSRDSSTETLNRNTVKQNEVNETNPLTAAWIAVVSLAVIVIIGFMLFTAWRKKHVKKRRPPSQCSAPLHPEPETQGAKSVILLADDEHNHTQDHDC